VLSRGPSHTIRGVSSDHHIADFRPIDIIELAINEVIFQMCFVFLFVWIVLHWSLRQTTSRAFNNNSFNNNNGSFKYVLHAPVLAY
jgi:hypothetical protein